MDRVATSFAMRAAADEFLRAQMRQVQAQVRVSTGKVATDLKGFGRDATTLTATRTVYARVEGFLDNAKSLTGRLDTQNLALERVTEVAGQARSTIASAIASGKADTLMIELNSWYGQAAQALNTKHDGTYIFAGGRVDVKPVQADDLTALGALTGAADAFHNDEAVPTSRLDEATTAVSGFLAKDVGEDMFTLFKDLQAYHAGPSGPLTGQLTPAQVTFLEGKLAGFADVQNDLISTTAKNGMIQSRVEDAVKTQKSRAVTLDTFLADVGEIDMADALSRLEQAEAALQASAYALKALQNANLLNILGQP